MKSSTFGLSPKTITRLLRIGVRPGSGKRHNRADDQKAAFLQRWIDNALPADAVPTRASQEVTEGEQEQKLFDTWIQWPIKKLLAVKTHPDMMTAMKDYAKARVASSRNEVDREVATVLYYAAIANAYVYHRQMITRHAAGHVGRALSMLKDKEWINPMIRDLFHKGTRMLGPS